MCTGADSETPIGLAPPPEESHPISTSNANPAVAVQDDATSDSGPDEGPSILAHTRPGEMLQKRASAVPGR